MPEKWTGELVGKMHNFKITQEDIAREMGTTKAYISMILNGSKTPKNAEKRLNDAFESAYRKKKMDG